MKDLYAVRASSTLRSCSLSVAGEDSATDRDSKNQLTATTDDRWPDMKIPPQIDPLTYDPALRAEHRAVKFTLRRLGERCLVVDVLNRSEELDLGRRLTFEALNDVRPLPILLRSARFSGSRSAVYPDGTVTTSGGRTVEGQIAHLATETERSAIGKAYRRHQHAFRAAGERCPVGMVFPYARAKGGWILHDGHFQTPHPGIIHTAGGTIRLEKYRELLQAIVAGDKGLAPVAQGVADENDDRRVADSVRRRYRRRTAGDLLLYLLDHQVEPLTTDQQARIQRQDGRRWIVINTDELAKEVGAGPRTIQKAVAELKAAGVLEVRRGGFRGSGNANGYWIDTDAVLSGFSC